MWVFICLFSIHLRRPLSARGGQARGCGGLGPEVRGDDAELQPGGGPGHHGPGRGEGHGIYPGQRGPHGGGNMIMKTIMMITIIIPIITILIITIICIYIYIYIHTYIMLYNAI